MVVLLTVPFLSGCDNAINFAIDVAVDVLEGIEESAKDAKEADDNSPVNDSNDADDSSGVKIQDSTFDDKSGLLEVHFIDVGQGDSALISKDNTNILVDAGDWKGDEVVPYLKEQGITDLSLVVGSHEHADHIGQMADVVNEFNVDEVWLPGNTHSSNVYNNLLEAIDENDVNYEEPRAGGEYQIGDLDIDVIHPKKLTGNLNNDSIVMKVTYEDVSFLFTGDIEAKAEKELLARTKDLKSTILKVSHHGSNTSSTSDFIRYANPSEAIISVGEDNKYKHPNKEVLDTLKNVASTGVYATKDNGSIVVKTDGSYYKVYSTK